MGGVEIGYIAQLFVSCLLGQNLMKRQTEHNISFAIYIVSSIPIDRSIFLMQYEVGPDRSSIATDNCLTSAFIFLSWDSSFAMPFSVALTSLVASVISTVILPNLGCFVTYY